MKNARPILFLILLIFLAVGTTLYLRGQEARQAAEVPEVNVEAKTVHIENPSPSTPEQSLPHQAEQKEKTVTESAPGLRALRADVAKNPHVPPPSFIQFASVLGKKMDAAESSPQKADALFLELSECTDNRDLPENVRALCLSNAYRMNFRNKDFQDRYNALRARTDSKIVHLAE